MHTAPISTYSRVDLGLGDYSMDNGDSLGLNARLFVLLGDYNMDNGESLGLKLGCVVLLGLSHDFNRILHVQCFRRWLLEVVCKT